MSKDSAPTAKTVLLVICLFMAAAAIGDLVSVHYNFGILEWA